MKNPDQEPKENDEIKNIEQFQIHRSGGNASEGHLPGEDYNENYTEQEIPFADGEGTKLDELIDEEEDEKDEN